MPVRTPGEVFAQQLRKVREKKGWSQRDLAARLTEMGAAMHQTAIAKIENGERKVSLDDAIRIAAALDVSPLSLLLPRDDDEQVVLAPGPAGRHFRAADVRRWIGGAVPLTALLWAEDDGEAHYRTVDGKTLTAAEAKERQRFYESEVSEREWRIRQVPGLLHFLRAAELYADQQDPAGRRVALEHLAAEVERQRAALDMEGV